MARSSGAACRSIAIRNFSSFSKPSTVALANVSTSTALPITTRPIKKQEVKDWLAKHPRFHLHFIPTSSSWLNLVERWFGKITTERIRRGVFTSVPELERAIYDYIEHNNADPKPFVWTKSANDIIRKVNRGRAALKMPPLSRHA